MAARSVGLVLFDLDGTLMDHDGAAAAAVEQWLTGAGLARAENIAGQVLAWHEIAEHHLPSYRTGKLTFQGQRRARLREFLPLLGIDATAWPDHRLDEMFADYLAAYEAAWRCFPDVRPCLDNLRASPGSLRCPTRTRANSRTRSHAPAWAATLEVVLTSGGLGVAKPHPEIFALACRELGVPSQHTVYVGDRLDVDALAAATAGLHGIWLARSRGNAPPGAEKINALAQLPPLLYLARSDRTRRHRHQ
ncbi:MAG TPA: HAD family hydrolase [Pseudonocardiaceae bacterium]|nr:HAD family hydrolase [Pseudonocardiaceae bacterium]